MHLLISASGSGTTATIVRAAEKAILAGAEVVALTTNLSSSLAKLANHVVLIPAAEKSIAFLVTKEFHCLADILVRDNFKTLGAKVKCVIGNHETLVAKKGNYYDLVRNQLQLGN